ncbi:hypothetical protein BU25DRAFT_482212 [Macroventuria anomochaeta]|uniref:Uncharacterized protein n=1 Tax=Macroventuria anomochaeta TaxID=301207 RepID=A0ACB6RJB7_9PLEO|nr:uncharacterized protein BU25DRAFT_482212 [Macroventuria anomochaeta]KAF2621918.1 hypothetical protein BU25DRAFT_482212 [Macroventuria anomochaeta]
MQLSKVALLLAALPTAFTAAVVLCPLGCHRCDGSQTIIWECVDRGNGIRAMRGVQHQDTPALVPTEADCQLGANKCDDTNSSVMICGAQGWKATESCSKVGACHVGPAGNAYCNKEVECNPGESQCVATNYVSKICNDKGFWETNRKCSKPGCCKVQDGKAVCKAECSPGQQPPAERSTLKAIRDVPMLGGYCTSVGERYCDEPAHDYILKCGSDKIFHQ